MKGPEQIINRFLKQQLQPGYLQTVMGMINPQKEGFNTDGTVSPFIQKTDDGKFIVKQGYSIVGKFNNLDDAKQKKKDLPALTIDGIKELFKNDLVKSEKSAKKYVESKGKVFESLPIKNQFILSNYHLTGDKNEDFFNAVLNNDYMGAIKNYKRPSIESANEFFKNVMFNGPINKNDLANTNQAQNFADNMLDQMYPDMPDDKVAKGEKGGKREVIAEFTGGELVNNKEDEMREAMAKGQDDKAAEIFRSQVKDKNITPGEASHKTNPLPVAEDGTIMDKMGKSTGMKAEAGSGIYDHIEDQYDSRMSNKSIIDMIKKNHNKWKKNNMD
jgi:hypothetical protein